MALGFVIASSQKLTPASAVLHNNLAGATQAARVKTASTFGGSVMSLSVNGSTSTRMTLGLAVGNATWQHGSRRLDADSLTSITSASAPASSTTYNSIAHTCSYTGSRARCYVSGLLDGTPATPSWGTNSQSNNPQNSFICAGTGGAGSFWGGAVQDLCFWIRELTAQEVWNFHVGFDRSAYDSLRHRWRMNEATSGSPSGNSVLDDGNTGSRINCGSTNSPVYEAQFFTPPAVIALLGQYGPSRDASTVAGDVTASFTDLYLGNEANRVAWCVVVGHNVTTGLTAAPTLNGASMTLSETHVAGAIGGFASIYYMLEAQLPAGSANGTAYTVSATVDGAAGEVAIMAGYIPGALQAAPEATGEADGTGTSLTASITTISNNAVIVAVGYNAGSTDDGTPGTDEIELCDFAGSATGPRLYCSSYLAATAGAYTPGWSALTTATQKIVVAVAIGPHVTATASGATASATQATAATGKATATAFGATANAVQVTAATGAASATGTGGSASAAQATAATGAATATGSGGSVAAAQATAGVGLGLGENTGKGDSLAPVQVTAGVGLGVASGTGGSSSPVQATAGKGTATHTGKGATSNAAQVTAATGAVVATGSGGSVAAPQVTSGYNPGGDAARGGGSGQARRRLPPYREY